MTTPDQEVKLLVRLEDSKDKGIPEDSISEKLDDFVDYLIRHEFAKWVTSGDHENLILTAVYSRSKVQL